MVSKREFTMLDIACGTKSASKAMLDRGWKVVTLDNDARFQPDILADIRNFIWQGDSPLLIWCSPPCDEFARESMPWCKTGQSPDMSIYQGCKRIIIQARPTYWIIENVKGAVPYFGVPTAVYGAFYLWGFFPSLPAFNLKYREKESYSSEDKIKRAMIPYELSLAIAKAIELNPYPLL